jgi:hypothetical protein
MKKKKKISNQTKTRLLFSIDEGIAEEFRYHCKKNKEKMSQLIQQWMHDYSVKNAGQ